MAQTPALLTASEVAEIVKASDESVRRWARQGKLPVVVLPSGAMRFRREDIEALLRPVDAA